MADPTLVEALEQLRTAGYTANFRITEDGQLRCDQCAHVHDPAEVLIESTARFEGASNPDDQAIVFGVRCQGCGVRGAVVAAYGPTATAAEAAVVTSLAFAPPDPEQVVGRFLAAVEAKDVDAALELVADDISYENMPMDPIVGKAATGAVLRSFLEPTSAVEWRVLRQVVAGNVVVQERLDRFQIGDGWLELPVAGFFEVGHDGRITRWRDYFDMATYTRQLSALTGGG